MKQENKEMLKNLIIELAITEPDFKFVLGSKIIETILFKYDVDEECYKVEYYWYNNS